MNYIVTDFQELDIEIFKKEISKGIEFEISFPLSSIGYSQSRIDVIRDYSEVSFCSEKIVQYITVLNSNFVIRDKYYTDFKIRCIAIDVESLTDELLYFSEMINGEFILYDELDSMSFLDEISEHEENYNKGVFVFPELINNYWANLINGAYWEIASEYYESESKFFNKTYKKFPEHRFGFWKGPLSNKFKETIYFSTESWIIPPNSNTLIALKAYSGIEEKDLLLEDSDKIEYKGRTVLINNFTAVYFNYHEQLLNAIKCTERVLNRNKTPENNKINESNTLNLFGENINQKNRKKRTNYHSDINIDKTKIKYKLSEYGDVVTIEYNKFTHVFFVNNTLNFQEIKDLHAFLFPAYSKTQNLINMSISENCNWQELNDDIFEELCYDILYCHPYFDHSTIQKMGKSRSRDGGRDITIKTRKNPTKEQELYIFQCKFFSDDKSLSATKIANAGNVIMQYGAKGYGVFTTTVIDATLYDMLDGFNRNMDIDVSFTWSKYELERHLNQYQLIKNKYFKKNKG
ncbi:restriction endonuclease [Flavobacterium zhairuonense]|uniref:hypothetical protein n=1 Tax=Flavobacterium zhairuonense TaxID=2493631 RepID=UPI00104EA4A0|nr:hypothetical protein [Flavobacterium zhairuonense]KAF2512119.1 restriction endonuclease [Flavobacterium zhairuonense]